MNIHVRNLCNADFDNMRDLLLTEGTNEWNHITEESIDFQFRLMRDGKALAVLAEDHEILGFAVLIFRDSCPSRYKEYGDVSSIASIHDVVVHSSEAGKGLGTELLRSSIVLAREEGCDRVLIERHEENLASAGMMRKAGFEVVETFADPKKRTSGSRKTTVMSVCT